MPVYEYECQSCHEVIEVWQSLSEDPIKTCPSCSGDLKKIISRSSFQLKGGGWFADGYSASPPTATTSSTPAPACPNAKGKACDSCG